MRTQQFIFVDFDGPRKDEKIIINVKIQKHNNQISPFKMGVVSKIKLSGFL